MCQAFFAAGAAGNSKTLNSRLVFEHEGSLPRRLRQRIVQQVIGVAACAHRRVQRVAQLLRLLLLPAADLGHVPLLRLDQVAQHDL